MELSIIIKSLIILTISILCSIQDIKYKKVYNWIIITGIIFMILIDLIFNKNNFLQYFVSTSIIFLVFFTTKLLMKNKLGWADVYFSIFIGFSVTYPFAILSIIVSIFVCLIYFLLLRKAVNESDKKSKIKLPFIPFLSLGLIMSYTISIL